MDTKFEALLLEVGKIRGTEEYVQTVKRIEEQGKEWNLLTGATEETIAFRTETAAYILERFEGVSIGEVAHLPLERKIEIIKKGENASGVQALEAIQEYGALPEIQPILENLEPHMRAAIQGISAGAVDRNTQWVIEQLRQCQCCRTMIVELRGYVGGYGYSQWDDPMITAYIDQSGNRLTDHRCSAMQH